MVFGSIIQDVLIRIRADFQRARDLQEAGKTMGEQLKIYKNMVRSSQQMTNARMQEMKTYKAFRFELLSTLFFGQMLAQTMNGLLQPAFQTAGVFDIISTILELLFLPIALALIDPLLALMDWFLSMPEGVQLVIGAIVLFLGILGTIIAFVSQVGLLLGSFGFTFTSLGALISGAFSIIVTVIGSALTAIVGALGGWIIVVIAIIILLITSIIFNVEGFVRAFTNLFENVSKSITDIIQGLFGMLEGIVQTGLGLIEGLMTGNWDRMNNGLKTFVDGFVQSITGFFNLVTGNFLNFGIDLGIAFATGLVRAYGAIKEAIRGIPVIGPMIAGGLDFGESIAGSIMGALGGIANSVGGMFSGIIPGFAEGGIVTRPTLAMVGERGPEAIVPLGNNSSMGSVIYYNPTYNISNDINSNADIDYMLDEIERRQANDYERLRKV